MIFTVINTIHSFWKSSSPTLLWPPARILSLFTTTTALWEGRELWCVLRETPNWTKLEFKTAFILECLWLLSGQDQYAWSLSRWGSGKGKQCDWRVCQALLKATHCFRSLGTFWKMIFLKKKKTTKTRNIHRSCHNGYPLEHHSNDLSQTLQTFHSSTNVFRLFRQSGRTLQLTGTEAFLVLFEIWESLGAFSKWLHSTFLLVSSWHLPLSGNTWELEGQTDIVHLEVRRKISEWKLSIL